MYEEKIPICDNEEIMTRLVSEYMAEKRKKKVFGNFRIEGDTLVYNYKPEYSDQHQTIIAKTISSPNGPIKVGNASILKYVGVTNPYGNTSYNHRTLLIQTELEKHIPMLPFSVFEETGLDTSKLEVLEDSGPEEVLVTVPNPKYSLHQDNPKGIRKTITERRHYTGAKLFRIENICFLFDIDRNEIKNKIFNPFLVKLPNEVKTIAQAYESLKPKEVKAAERKKTEVLRQGEWFFIKTRRPKMPKLNAKEKRAYNLMLKQLKENKWVDEEPIGEILGLDLSWNSHNRTDQEKYRIFIDKIPAPRELQAGPNRPNEVSQGILVKKVWYVSGTVSHTGREHKDLELKGWYRAIPNTAQNSWTITGDID